MTERLYYGDPYLREFDAIVTAVDRRGDRIVVTLDRTAFYPTSGGQPFDIGMLAGRPIVDVTDEEDGTIVHVVGPGADQTFTMGEAVRGQIDWPRRFDHMQQHTGQHLLSAVLDRLFGARTVSFHLGTEASTIDLGRELSPRELAAAEDEANRVVWEDRPVTIRYASAGDAAGLGLRKASRREGTLRLIDIEGADVSACGGTHVARTGAIGMIAVLSWERFKGGHRLEFLCGGRALGRFRSLRDPVSAGVGLLSALPGDLPAAIERMQADAKTQNRRIAALQDDLVRYRSAELSAEAEVAAAGRMVIRAVDADAVWLKALATSVAATPGYVVALISTARPALVVVARSSDLSVPANAVLASLTARFGGRGGGGPGLAQGGGLDASTDTILEAVRSAIAGSTDHGS
jgi:alanyl-tRNA synthetase